MLAADIASSLVQLIAQHAGAHERGSNAVRQSASSRPGRYQQQIGADSRRCPCLCLPTGPAFSLKASGCGRLSLCAQQSHLPSQSFCHFCSFSQASNRALLVADFPLKGFFNCSGPLLSAFKPTFRAGMEFGRRHLQQKLIAARPAFLKTMSQ